MRSETGEYARSATPHLNYSLGMPFKSKAQRRKFAELLVTGEITPETFEEWNRETGGRDLPERVKKKAKTRAATSVAKRAKPRKAKKASKAKRARKAKKR